METIQEIRRANLQLLLDEVTKELGGKRGSKAELARRTGVPSTFISQFLNKRKHQGGGLRAMGDSQARKLETGMGRPEGWMDVDHTVIATEQDISTLGALKSLTPDQRTMVEMQIAEFARLNGSSSPPPNLRTGAKPH